MVSKACSIVEVQEKDKALWLCSESVILFSGQHESYLYVQTELKRLHGAVREDAKLIKKLQDEITWCRKVFKEHAGMNLWDMPTDSK